MRSALPLGLNVCFPSSHLMLPLALFPFFSEAGSGTCKPRPACTVSDYFYTHTPCDSKGKVSGVCRKQIISNHLVQLRISGRLRSCTLLCVWVFRLSSCTSGSSQRSAARLLEEPWSCLHQARSKPVLRATRDSSSPTRPPVNPATKGPTPTEQVWNSQTLHATWHARQTEEPLPRCSRVFLKSKGQKLNFPLRTQNGDGYIKTPICRLH